MRSKLVSSFDLLHVPALDDLAEDTLIEQILNIEFGYFGIAQSDDLPTTNSAIARRIQSVLANITDFPPS